MYIKCITQKLKCTRKLYVIEGKKEEEACYKYEHKTCRRPVCKFKSHESNQTNMNSTNKTAAKVAEELNQSNENSDKIERYLTHKGKIRRILKKFGKQSNAWPVY